MTALAQPGTALPGVTPSSPAPLPFATAVDMRAFLLQRERGNVLIYGAPLLDADLAGFRELGGVARHYLNHRHEAAFATRALSAPLFVHERDARAVARELPVRATFSRRHRLDDDLEVIPIPGHTPGATAYLWEHGGHRMLFPGDTLWLRGGEWVAAVLDSSDRAAYLGSLELIRSLDFDVLVPWNAPRGQAIHAHTDAGDARRRLDRVIARVRGGEAF